jgi:hypothetical protein
MNAMDAYLGEVRRAMGGMDPRVRDDILRELKSHMLEASAANGGDAGVAVSRMGPARDVGRNYRKLYGYGRPFQGLFIGIAAILATLSVPVLASSDIGTFPSILSVPFLIGLVAWLLWVSVAAGSRVGLIAGVAGFVVRISAAVVVGITQTGAATVPGGLLFFGLSSGLLVVVAWLPGTAKKALTRPDTEL